MANSKASRNSPKAADRSDPTERRLTIELDSAPSSVLRWAAISCDMAKLKSQNPLRPLSTLLGHTELAREHLGLAVLCLAPIPAIHLGETHPLLRVLPTSNTPMSTSGDPASRLPSLDSHASTHRHDAHMWACSKTRPSPRKARADRRAALSFRTAGTRGCRSLRLCIRSRRGFTCHSFGR
jgi:hypothetical protein